VTGEEPTAGSAKVLSPKALGVAALITALAAFGIGLGIAALDRGTEEVPVAAPTTVTAAAPGGGPASTTSSSTTSTTIAIAPPPSVTVPPPPPTSTSTTAVPPTVVITEPPTSATPAFVEVRYPQGSQGQIVMQAGSTIQVQFTNTGGSIGQWLIQGSGYVFVVGPTNGTLSAGQSRFVTVQAAPEVPKSGVDGTLTMTTSGNGTITVAVHILP
jgi:hypothetical protein